MPRSDIPIRRMPEKYCVHLHAHYIQIWYLQDCAVELQRNWTGYRHNVGCSVEPAVFSSQYTEAYCDSLHWTSVSSRNQHIIGLQRRCCSWSCRRDLKLVWFTSLTPVQRATGVSGPLNPPHSCLSTCMTAVAMHVACASL